MSKYHLEPPKNILKPPKEFYKVQKRFHDRAIEEVLEFVSGKIGKEFKHLFNIEGDPVETVESMKTNGKIYVLSEFGDFAGLTHADLYRSPIQKRVDISHNIR